MPPQQALSCHSAFANYNCPLLLSPRHTLNLDFTFRKTRFGAASSAANVVTLPQLLCVRTLSTAAEGAAAVRVNGTLAGTIRLKPNATNTLFLAAKLFNATTANRISLTRTDGGSAAIGLDQIKGYHYG